MDNIIIGKHTLESLTMGMYSEPYVIYREYIQNSVDSIDEAIQKGVLKRGMELINIKLFPSEKKIVIYDNGLGISESNAEIQLVSVGNSYKSSVASRGFRGIGRLSGLSYCERLTFKTSYLGESNSTVIVFDAAKLRDILSNDSHQDMTMNEVLKSVYSVDIIPENKDEHYFIVELEGIEDTSKLLSFFEVENYLCQNAPAPYSPDFIWGKEIFNRLQKENFIITEYNISISCDNRTKAIYKPYKDMFLVDKNKNIKDTIQDVSIIKFTDRDRVIALGWLASSNYKGSITDKSIKGIRLRKGNILVGDHQTLNSVFKEARFNGWSIGEIFVIDKKLIPNARRDNFEKNEMYYSLIEQLKFMATNITKEIRMASLKRNESLSGAIKNAQQLVKEVNEAIGVGVTGPVKGRITKQLKKVQAEVDKSVTKEDFEEYYKGIAFDELDLLLGKIQGVTRYKAVNVLDNISNSEKKILEKVIFTIEHLDIDDKEFIIDSIVKEFSSKSMV